MERPSSPYNQADVLNRKAHGIAPVELTDHVLAVDAGNSHARQLKAAALTELGERQVNATARNYYLTSAQFLLKQ